MSMGSQHHCRSDSYKKLLILLTFFCSRFCYTVCASSPSSSSSEVENCKEKPGSFDYSIFQPFCLSEQYIMQSYFENRSSLTDSDFQDFIIDNHSPVSCAIPQDDLNFASGSSLLHRDITGEGSHRYLTTSVRIKISQDSISQPLSNSCKTVIIERLPLGVFADPFELQSLQQRGAFTDVAVFGDTNLELPSFRSNRSVVEIHMGLDSKVHSEMEVSVKLPLHARYQPLGDNGYSRVEFGEPDLFICCRDNKKELHHNRCKVLSIGSSNSERRSVWDIPSGVRAHTQVVSAVTFVSAVISALTIIVASVYRPEIKLHKNKKLS